MAFEAHRARLTAVAYRVLGSHADADDAVQETWLRLSRQDANAIDNLGGWLTTVVGRISLDLLRSGRTRPTVPLDNQLPEPTVTLDAGPTPEELVTLGDLVGLALLTVLDSLGPDERLAFVLHDVFAVPHGEVGTILGRSTDATKMLTSRARRKVQAVRHSASDRQQQREVVGAFLAAAREGRFERLLEVLHPDDRRGRSGRARAHGPARPGVTVHRRRLVVLDAVHAGSRRSPAALTAQPRPRSSGSAPLGDSNPRQGWPASFSDAGPQVGTPSLAATRRHGIPAP
ncbi:sigma-70 family RNA polymerase sigma factor [Streptomyces coelicoflavus]|uniref:sigma-70 family RNA polymerase sigma factor n=1 Tax=Streptomyces coelicoflavus TaxID=285562 RepID=UPI00210C5D4C|nr:sigma-70 family RNA polymerase sigma factor [Streptomyces coelicoflavus]MCQ4200036.1 sigma-70 family RNA polymerase sigma factor [Streptomyces coelicoflavus]